MTAAILFLDFPVVVGTSRRTRTWTITLAIPAIMTRSRYEHLRANPTPARMVTIGRRSLAAGRA